MAIGNSSLNTPSIGCLLDIVQWHLTSARHVAWHLNSDFCWLQFKSRYESYQISWILHRNFVQTNVSLSTFSSIVSLIQNLLCTSKFVGTKTYLSRVLKGTTRLDEHSFGLFWADMWHKGVNSFLNYQTLVWNHCSCIFNS